MFNHFANRPTVVYQQSSVTIHQGDSREVLKELPEASVSCCVTSPPYWGLRDYGHDDQIGLETTPQEYVAELVSVFDEVWRVLADDGTVWLNLGDTYCASPKGSDNGWEKSTLTKPNATRTGPERQRQIQIAQRASLASPHRTRSFDGLKPKDLVGIPWRVAFALQDAGWYLRQDIIWSKPTCLPESVKDRCTKSHEYLFLLSKSGRYYFDHDQIKLPALDDTVARYDRGRSDIHNWSDGGPGNQTCAKSLDHMKGVDTANRRSVWHVSPKPYKGAHFATFPPNLIEPCILAGCPEGGTVLDPFGGSGTTAEVAKYNGRKSIMIELNPDYIDLMRKRLEQETLFGAADE